MLPKAKTTSYTLQDVRALRLRAEKQALLPGDYPVVTLLVRSVEQRMERQQERLAAKAKALEPASPAPSGEANDVKTGGEAEGEKPSVGDANEPEAGPKPKAPGHGRGGAKAHAKAQKIRHPLTSDQRGARCPGCGRGILHPSRPQVRLRITSSPLFESEVHEVEQARCRGCNYTVSAAFAKELNKDICGFDFRACAMLIVLHYLMGLPFKRIEMLQRAMGIPVSDALLWDVVDECDDALLPVGQAMEKHAGKTATSVRLDDTGASVAALERQIADELAVAKALGLPKETVRTGINTSGLYCETPDGPIVLYYTGRHHVGEVLGGFLSGREKGRPVIKVSDAASKNFDHRAKDKTDEAACNVHARRSVTDDAAAETEAAGLVKGWYREVYQADAYCKKMGMTPEERLAYHQQHSQKPMDEILAWAKGMAEQKRVDPRSPLWQGLSILINQWPRLTLFLRVPGVPLDTNLVEQALKLAIRYRGASRFYKTQSGADAGDRMMSLIATARLHGVNPAGYLVWLLEHADELRRDPQLFLPWEYKKVAASQPAQLKNVTPR